MIFINKILRKYFTTFKARRKKEKEYYRSMEQELLKVQLENERFNNMLKIKERIEKIFPFKVPEDILFDIAELEQAEEKDFNCFEGGMIAALIGKRISKNDATIVANWLYNRYRRT